ncbi:MAG TPA: SCO family protein [Vicinamibacterales bacterium]|nr:SCO family protein [Vicinamibacterales bacterium]
MRRNFIALLIILASVAGCSEQKRYTLAGQIIAIDTTRQEITVKHQDIRGFMPGMTMAFKVRDAAQMSSRQPGDLITATLVVEASRGVLEDIRKTGEAPLPAAAPSAPAAPPIEKGSLVPDAEFLDQDGRKHRLADWKGKALAVTFIYTRCPLPDFCPLMDRQFAAVQQALKADSDLASRVHLLSVSFDPSYDTPDVLKTHAGRVHADPALWTYLTGAADAIDRFAAGFGVTIMREDPARTEIVHNLRTAVIDKEGRLVTVLRGNEWKPDQLVDELRAADGRR